MKLDKAVVDKRSRMQIAAVILLTFLVVFAGIISIYIKKLDRTLEHENQIHLAEAANYVTTHMTRVVTDTQKSLESIADAVVVIQTSEDRIEYLNRMAKKHEFSYIGYAAKDGMLHANVVSESKNISEEDYFKRAIKGENVVSNLTRKIFKNKAASGILLAVPIGEESTNGVLVAMLEISQLSDSLNFESFGGDGYAYVFDKTGAIIMRNKSLDFNNLFSAWKTADFEKGYSYAAFYNNIMNDEQGMLCYSYLGAKKYAYYHPIPFNDWFVVNIVAEEAVAAGANKIIRQLIMIGAITVAGILLLIYLAMLSYSASQDSRQATDAKSAFLANMSHEIRTPMNAIVGISEILLRDSLTPRQREEVLNILNSGRGLLTIINDILDISKIESGKFTIVDEPYELESMLYDLTVITAIRIGEKPVEFMMDISPTLPRRVVGDMGRVKQVLINIVGNAIKFTSNGSICLTVDGERDESGWTLRMEVKDTGIGIKEEDLQKLFISFNQVDEHRNRNVEGTGLGLTISRRLCQMMGGDISVDSQYGEGSSFVITIHQGVDGDEPAVCDISGSVFVLVCEPSGVMRKYEISCMDKLSLRYDVCKTVKEFEERLAYGKYTHAIASQNMLVSLNDCKPLNDLQTIAMYKLSENSLIDSDRLNIYAPLFSIQLPSALNGEIENTRAAKHAGMDVNVIEEMPYVSILIVDDNLVNIQVARGLMEPYAMQIDSATSGEEAIEAVQNKVYDLVLMDHMMPGMSGVETLNEIRKLPNDRLAKLPIVALTANATSGAREMFIADGFDGFLAKPIETQKLNQVLRKYLKALNEARTPAHPIGAQLIGMSAGDTASFGDLTEKAYGEGEVNFAKGRDSIGTQSIYLKILKTYLDYTDKKLSELENWLENDPKRFVIEIHGLKSSSASIGAEGLSADAAKMEKQGNDGDFDSIKGELAPFIERCKGALAEIGAFLTDSESQGAQQTTQQSRPADELGISNSKHIVVVDDNLVNLNLAGSVLSDEYRVTKLDSGKKLLSFLEDTVPDMVLLDIQMPEMDGYATLKAVYDHDEWKNIPVIFLTGQNDIISEREGFRLGAKDFIKKPFDRIVMLSRVRLQMELYQYQTELEKIVKEKTDEVADLQHVITVSWAEIIESRDGTTGSHVRNTTRYYKTLLDLLMDCPEYSAKVPAGEIDDLLRASSLHDIGKIGISDMVLKKPGSLTIEEYTDMKQHAKIGADMIQKIIDNTRPDQFLLYAHDMALWHHERWDGTGYPIGMAAQEIPFYVQALTIADVFDALTAVRPYKRAFTFDEAIDIMEKDRGKFYSPDMFDVFIKNKDKMKQVLDTKDKRMDKDLPMIDG